ncbi:hypothetical protein RvY_05376 [Ramazzottius varieornatus]|uniref:thioredoxin-dependent peroxiredoxin n=1 Tax=Ramazzottius varieornatus TaxID=947166 RepID=A0A1D1UUS9_RAMVA|nr:hypothetical protein RvY_05376 [Ramazzottius varieornatus]
MSFESPRLYIGEPAPDFKVPALIDGEMSEIELSKFGKGKYVVLFFYPADFTFVCPTELIAYSERIEEFRKLNCEVIGASTDTLYTHLAWMNTPRKEGGIGPLKYPLLADRTAEVSKRYGLYDHGSGNAYRGLFVIDSKGNLRQITINDMPVGRSVDETLRLVQAFQFVEEHGQVCPANWKPGQDAMHADPAKSKAYFAKSEQQK